MGTALAVEIASWLWQCTSGSILTISCMSFPETYCAPDAYRLEKFSPHGLLLAYTDHTSRKEQHVGPGGFFGFPGRSMRGQNVVASRDAVFVADTRKAVLPPLTCARFSQSTHLATWAGQRE